MESVAQLQIVTEFLLRNCQEKDHFIMSCAIPLRLCHCGTVSSKLIDDLTYLESKISNKAYKSLFTKTLNFQELQQTGINPNSINLSNSTDLNTPESEVSRQTIENIQQDTQYTLDCATLHTGNAGNISVLGEDSTIQTISLPPYPGSSTMLVTEVPMVTEHPLEATEAILTSEPSVEGGESMVINSGPSSDRTDSPVQDSEHIAEESPLENSMSEVVLQTSAVESKSSNNGIQSAIVVLKARKMHEDSVISTSVIASDSSEQVVDISGVKATEHCISEMETESVDHKHSAEYVQALEIPTLTQKVGDEETILAATESTLPEQVPSDLSDSQDVPQKYSVLTETVSDLINSDMNSLTSLNDLNTVAIVAGENGPVFVYEQLCDDGQIIVVTSEEASENENGSNEITVLAETASLQQPMSSEADVSESLEGRDITEFTTEEEQYELMQRMEVDQVHDKSTVDRMFVCRLCNKAYRRHAGLKEHMIIHDKARREKYKCTICGKGFSKPSLLKSHMEHHNRLKPFQCEVCHKRFAQKSCQTRHMKIHTKEKPYACSVCDKRFNQFGHAQKHMNMHADNRHKCSLCPRTFPTFEKLKKHHALHEKLKRTESNIECDKPVFTKHLPRKELKYSCKYCPERFAKESELLAHDENHAEDRPFQCEICGYRCLQLKNLKYHKKSHKESADHVCDICGKRFRSAFWLTNHILEHKGEKSFMCEDCGEVFTLQCMLTRHRVRRHGVKPIRKCKSCGLICPSLKALKHHRAKAHRDMRLKYGCKKCPERFSAVQLLVQHLKSHVEDDTKTDDGKKKDDTLKESNKEKEEDYKQQPPTGKTGKRRTPCPICRKQLHPGSINKHVQAHGGARLSKTVTKTGQPRTPCTVCNQLISETSMYTHMRLHKRKGEVKEEPRKDDGKLREPCEVCGKMCIPHSLPKHRLLHLSEPPFSCDVCGKRFTQKSNVTRHKRARHPEK